MSFFFCHPKAYGVPEPETESELQLRLMPQLQQCQILNPLHQAGDRAHIPAAAETLSTLLCPFIIIYHSNTQFFYVELMGVLQYTFFFFFLFAFSRAAPEAYGGSPG